MPAKNEKQRRLMGAALAAKRSGRKAGGEIGKVASSMSESQLRGFARKPTRSSARPKRRSYRSRRS